MQITDQTLNVFAEHGLTGVAMFMLLVVVFAFIRTINRKDAAHRSFTEKLLSEAKEERKEIATRFITTYEKVCQALDDLKDAINVSNQERARNYERDQKNNCSLLGNSSQSRHRR